MGLCLYVFGNVPSDDEDPEEIAECDVGRRLCRRVRCG